MELDLEQKKIDIGSVDPTKIALYKGDTKFDQYGSMYYDWHWCYILGYSEKTYDGNSKNKYVIVTDGTVVMSKAPDDIRIPNENPIKGLLMKLREECPHPR